MPFTLLDDDPTQPEEEPSFVQEALRHAGRTAVRVGEQVAGYPGDILSLVNEYISGPPTAALTGKEQIPYEELGISSILPTSEQLRKGHEKQFGESVKPKNKIESFGDDVIGTATSIFSPGGLIKKGVALGKGMATALFKSIGAHTAKEAVKDWTGSDKKGAMAHLGALTLLSFVDKKGAAKAISDGYKPLEARAAQLMPVPATKLENSLNNLKSKVSKGTLAPSEKFIVDEVDAVLSKIKRGQITPEEAWASKRSLNEKLSSVLYQTPGKSQPRARKLASEISHELDNALKLTEKQDPKFYKELKGWNSAYKAVADSNLVSRWVEKNLKHTPVTTGLLHMFGGPAASTLGVAAVPYFGMKVAYRVAKSPKLLAHYSKALAAAAAEDAVSFDRQLKLMDKELQNEEKKSKFSLID
jgi:hypothetical protein